MLGNFLEQNCRISIVFPEMCTKKDDALNNTLVNILESLKVYLVGPGADVAHLRNYPSSASKFLFEVAKTFLRRRPITLALGLNCPS